MELLILQNQLAIMESLRDNASTINEYNRLNKQINLTKERIKALS